MRITAARRRAGRGRSPRRPSPGPGITGSSAGSWSASGTEVGIEWTDGDGATTFLDRPAAEQAYLGWLGPQLARAQVAVRRGQRGIHLGLPPGTRYTTDAAIATVLGPRDEAWLDAAIADPRVALDITPWWADATDGRYLLHRALTLLWLEVRWRAPAVEGEADLLDEVHRLLSRAFPMDPGLPYPWHAWAEVCAFRGINDHDGPPGAGRAAREPEPSPPVGYRRDPVRDHPRGLEPGGPGLVRRAPDAGRVVGRRAGRSITLAATRTGLADGGADVRRGLRRAVRGRPRAATRSSHREGEVLGRARLTTDASSGVEIGVLEGYSAVRGSGAAIRITFDDPGDWQWAVETWRSLARLGHSGWTRPTGDRRGRTG